MLMVKCTATQSYLHRHPDLMDSSHLTLLGVSFKILAILFLVVLNGFFVAAEFAIVKVRWTQIEPLAKKKNMRAKLAENMLIHLDAYLSATQLGITLASLGLGWLGEPFVAELLRPLLLQLGVHSPTLLHSLSFTIGFSFITFLHIVIGELAPKSLAIQRARGTTLWVAMPLTIFYKGLYPVIWLLNKVANRALYVMGLRPASEQELGYTEEELRLLLSESSGSMAKNSLSGRILGRVFNLKVLKARNIMLPRNKIEALYLEMPLPQNLEVARAHRHTRFPVCRKTLDDVVGMVHIKYLLWTLQSQKEPINLETICHEILFFPEFSSLETMLKTFLEKKCHMGMIVDEFGGTLGLVTLEDILEELVGEIQDEFDQEPPLIIQLSQKKYMVDGGTPLHDIEEAFGIRFNGDHDATTLGGYLINYWRDIPKEGAESIHDNLKLSVRRVEKRRISQVLVQILE